MYPKNLYQFSQESPVWLVLRALSSTRKCFVQKPLIKIQRCMLASGFKSHKNCWQEALPLPVSKTSFKAASDDESGCIPCPVVSRWQAVSALTTSPYLLMALLHRHRLNSSQNSSRSRQTTFSQSWLAGLLRNRAA